MTNIKLTLPRDAYNVSTYLNDIANLYTELEKQGLQDKLTMEENNFTIMQDKYSGDLYMPSIKLLGEDLFRPYNSREPNQLFINDDEIFVLDSKGNLSTELLEFLKS